MIDAIWAFCMIFALLQLIAVVKDGGLWATGTIVAVAVVIALLIQTWAKKK